MKASYYDVVDAQNEKIKELQAQIQAFMSLSNYIDSEYCASFGEAQFRSMKQMINIQAKQLRMLRKKDYQEEVRSAKAVNNKLSEQLRVNEILTNRVEQLENKTC